MKQIKVLHIIATLRIGGAEVQLVNLVKNLDCRLFKNIVCCLAESGQLSKELSDIGIKVIVLNKKKFNPLVIISLYRIIKKEKIDIVHTQMFRAGIWGRIAAILANVKVIIATEHGLNLWKNAVHIAINRFLARYTDLIIAVSKAAEKIRIQREKIPPEKLTVIYNSIDLQQFDSLSVNNGIRQEFGIGHDELVVGFVGRLMEVKGIKYLVESFAEIINLIPKARLIIVGDGPILENLKNQARSCKVEERIIFTGYRRDIPQILSVLDVFVLPSLREDMPLSIIEAMAAKKPVIATSVGGVPEVVTDGETGFLVPPENTNSLTNAIFQVLSNQQLALTFSLAARCRVEELFSIESATAKIQKIYSELINKKS